MKSFQRIVSLRECTKFSMNKQISKDLIRSYSKKKITKNVIDMSLYPNEVIRNFSIIAHVDHGKSTLADKLLELTGSKNKEAFDGLQVEQERGITVKAKTCAMFLKRNGKTFLLNLVDTPGHVDFSYEVSRSIMGSEIVLLLVDGTQGIQAQTLANYYLALEQNADIIPVITKIDMDDTIIEEIEEEMIQNFGFDKNEIIKLSARSGLNCEIIFDKLINESTPPKGDPTKPLKALIFDSWYDEFFGVICLIQIKDGFVSIGDKISLFHNQKNYTITGLGILTPELIQCKSLKTGQVGYIICGMKSTNEARIGDTVFLKDKMIDEPLPGFKPVKPLVYAGIYPTDSSNFDKLNVAINKLLLTDSSVRIQKETSLALGIGFRVGFLGMLHMEVFSDRLEQEYGAEVIITTPTVTYKIEFQDGTEKFIDNPKDFPEEKEHRNVRNFYEPIVEASLMFPKDYLQEMIQICEERRGNQKSINFIGSNRCHLIYTIPLIEVIKDFHDKVKSISKGYATFDYEEVGYQQSNLVKINILLNKEPVDAMSIIVDREKSVKVGRELVDKLKDVISRQLFQVNIQASVGNKIISSERLSAFRKDVTAKCYGGDQSRKKKLLEKQKEGKKRMKTLGNIQ
eukprot:gene1149-10663_t